MIKWWFHIKSNDHESTVDVLNDHTISINETDYLDVGARIPSEFFSLGDPYVLVGDVPISMELVSSTTEYREFKTSEQHKAHQKQWFYNYFGESEALLCFEGNNTPPVFSVAVNVRARKANAELARMMIDYISDNMDDTLLLCFSKSRIGTGSQTLNKETLTRFQILKDTISDIIKHQSLFVRDHKYAWEPELNLSDQGQPSGPSSVHYLLNHLDVVTPSDPSQANFRVNHRSYKIAQVPCEDLITNTDIFENRVIYSFLHAAKVYLHKLKINSAQQIDTDTPPVDNDDRGEFVTFDNVLRDYKTLIIKHYIDDIDELNNQLDRLIALSDKHFKSKLIPSVRPRITPFVAARPHYRSAFININQWYLTDSPDLSSNNFLMGLRNLSTIYEIVCLLILNNTLTKRLNFEFIEANYRTYDENISYQGKLSKRPADQPNNCFEYSFANTTATLKYEPRIYQYKKGVTQEGDLINITNRNRHHLYGAHYYKPDFALTFSNITWDEDIVVIIDAKYQNKKTLTEYALPETEQKYIKDISQLKSNGRVGTSPIQLLLLLFAHGPDKTVSRIHKRHRLGEPMQVLPQALGVKTTPGFESEVRITECLNELLKIDASIPKSDLSNATEDSKVIFV